MARTIQLRQWMTSNADQSNKCGIGAGAHGAQKTQVHQGAERPCTQKEKSGLEGPLFPYRMIRVDQKDMFRPSDQVELSPTVSTSL